MFNFQHEVHGSIKVNGVKIRQSAFIAAHRNSLSYRLSNPAEAAFAEMRHYHLGFLSLASDYLALNLDLEDSRKCLQQFKKKWLNPPMAASPHCRSHP